MPFPNFHSARQLEPDDFEPDGMGQGIAFKTIKIADGITAIVGKLKKPPKDSNADSTHVQTYRFDKDKFTEAEAKAWLKKHNLKVGKFEKAVETKNEQLLNEGDDMPKETEKNEIYVKIPNSFEEMREKLNTAISDSGLFGTIKDEWGLSIEATFPDSLIVVNRTEDNPKYYQANWSLDKDNKIVFSNVKPIEISAVVKVKNEQELKNRTIIPLNEDIQTGLFLEEISDASGKKQYKGKVKVAQKADIRNRNGRIYPEKVLTEAVNGLKEKLKIGPVPIYRGHRTSDGKNATDLNEIIGLIHDVNFHPEDKTVSLDDITFVETQAGKDVIALAEAKMPFQVSQRGEGKSHLIKGDNNIVSEIVDSLSIDGWDVLRAGKASVANADMEFQVLTEEMEMPDKKVLTEEEVKELLRQEREAILNEMKNIKPTEIVPAKPTEEPKPEVDKSAVVLNEMKTQMAAMNEAIEAGKKEKTITALTKSAETILNEELKDDKYKTFTADGKKHITDMTLKHIPELYGKVDVSKHDELKIGVIGMLNEHYEEVAKFMADTRLASMGYPKPGGTGIQSVQVINEHLPEEERIVKLNEAIEYNQVVNNGNSKFFTDPQHPVMLFEKKIEDMMIREFYQRLNESNELTQSTIGPTLLTVGVSFIRSLFPRLSALQVCSVGTMDRLLDVISIKAFSRQPTSNPSADLITLTTAESVALNNAYTGTTAFNLIATQKAHAAYITSLAIATAKNTQIDVVADTLDDMLRYFQTVINSTIWAVMIAKAQEYAHTHVTSFETLTQQGTTAEYASIHPGWVKYEYVKDETGNPATAVLCPLYGTLSGNTMQGVVVQNSNSDAFTLNTHYTINWADGSVTLTATGITLLGAYSLQAKYTCTTNARFWSVIPPTGISGLDHLTNLGLSVDQAAALVRNRDYDPTFVGMSYTNNARIARSTDYTAAGARNGNVLNMNGLPSLYCGMNAAADRLIDDQWLVVGTQGKMVYRIHTPMKIKGPITVQGKTDDEYQFEQYDAIDNPEGGAFALVGITDINT